MPHTRLQPEAAECSGQVLYRGWAHEKPPEPVSEVPGGLLATDSGKSFLDKNQATWASKISLLAPSPAGLGRQPSPGRKSPGGDPAGQRGRQPLDFLFRRSDRSVFSMGAPPPKDERLFKPWIVLDAAQVGSRSDFELQGRRFLLWIRSRPRSVQGSERRRRVFNRGISGRVPPVRRAEDRRGPLPSTSRWIGEHQSFSAPGLRLPPTPYGRGGQTLHSVQIVHRELHWCP